MATVVPGGFVLTPAASVSRGPGQVWMKDAVPGGWGRSPGRSTAGFAADPGDRSLGPKPQSGVQSTAGRRGCGPRVTVTSGSLTGAIVALNPGGGTPLRAGSNSLASRGERQRFAAANAESRSSRPSVLWGSLGNPARSA